MSSDFPAHAAFTFLNQSRDVFVIADSGGALRYVSPSAANLFGFKNADILGKPATLFIHADDHEALGALCADAVAHVKSQEPKRLRHITTAGSYVPMDCRACFDGELLYIVMLDASEATKMEDSLRQSLSASHDLRTPVHSIQACASLMLADAEVASDAEAVRLLRGMQSACEVLTLNIGNVLSLGSLHAPPRLNDDGVEPRAALAYAARLICGERVMWARAGVVVEKDDALEALPACARGDKLHVTLCLENALLTTARMLGWHDPDAEQCVDVLDDAGISLRLIAPGFSLSEDECESLIAPFGVTPVDKGSVPGLPLFLARRMARAMGGDLVLRCDTDAHGATPAGIAVQLSLPLPCEDDSGGIGAHTGNVAAPTPAPAEVVAKAKELLPPRMTELEVSRRMFGFLTQISDDLFLIASLQPNDQYAVAAPTYLSDAATMPGRPQLATLVRISYVSPNVVNILGVPAAEFVGRDASDVLIERDDVAQVAAALASAALEARRAPGWLTHVALCFCARRYGGGADAQPPLWMDATCVTDGEAAFFVLRDATARRAEEATLRRFSIAATSGLRDPCGSVLLGAELLQHRPCMRRAAAEATPNSSHLAAEYENPYASPGGCGEGPPFLLAAVRAACSLLLGVLGNVASARALEAGELALKPTLFSIAAVVEAVLRTVQLAGGGAASPSSRFIWERDAADALPPLVEGDAQRVAEVLLNLCTNAQKWGEGRPVRVRANLDWRSCLVLTVADAGAGLTPEAAAGCWARGVRCSAEAGGGVGLGLFVSSALARLMGGALTVKSALGAGASFTLTVPVRVLGGREAAAASHAAEVAAAAAAAEAAGRALSTAAARDVTDASSAVSSPSPQRHAAKRYRALLADDPALNLLVVMRLLTAQGFDVTAVPDGQVALDALAATLSDDEATPPYDVAVLDVQMPRLDGPGAARAYRAMERQRRAGRAALPILALSAAVADEALGACTDAGMTGFISKPLRAEAIAMVRACAAEHAEARAMEEAAHVEE